MWTSFCPRILKSLNCALCYREKVSMFVPLQALCCVTLFIEEFLKTLCIVSDARVIDEGSMGCSNYEWEYTQSVSIPGMHTTLPAENGA